jgi:hypothetical protein
MLNTYAHDLNLRYVQTEVQMKKELLGNQQLFFLLNLRNDPDGRIDKP